MSALDSRAQAHGDAGLPVQSRNDREATIMLHTVSGHNFHGRYEITLRGPAEGFVLSDAQAGRYWRELCPFEGCTCGGGYGEGPDRDSATVEQDFGRNGESILRLVPAAKREA